MQDHSRLYYLDSIRGIAALLVAYFHFLIGPVWNDLPSHNMLDEVIRFVSIALFDLGKIGIVVFFAISGFVIPITLLKKQQKFPRVVFVLKRFFRLYPAYWLSILLAVLVTRYDCDAQNVALNMTMFQRFFGGDDLLDVYWTLQIEIVFYVLCVFLLRFRVFEIPERAEFVSYFFLGLALLLAVFRYNLNIKLPVALMLALSIMFWASIWRERLLGNEREVSRKASRYIYVFFVAMPIISLLAYNMDLGKHEVWYRYVLSYYVGMLVFIIMTTWLRIRSRIMIYLGEISYSVYLMHLIVLALMHNYEIGIAMSDVGVPIQVIAALYLFVVIVLSSVVYHLVELPGQKLGVFILSKTIYRNAA